MQLVSAWKEAAEALDQALGAAWDHGVKSPTAHKLALKAGHLLRLARTSESHESKMRALLKGIRKIRAEITASDGDTPRWVPIDLNALCNEFMDEKGNLK